MGRPEGRDLAGSVAADGKRHGRAVAGTIIACRPVPAAGFADRDGGAGILLPNDGCLGIRKASTNRPSFPALSGARRM